MMDLKGRTIRTSHFATKEGVTYDLKDMIEFRTDGHEIESTKDEIQISLYDLPPVMREGDAILLGDNGQVCATVKEISRTSFTVEVTSGGQVSSNSVIKVPSPRVQ